MRDRFYPVASVLKATEGGLSQKDILAIAKRRGIECKVGPSCYIGHTCVMVKTEDQRKIRGLLSELF